MQVIKVNEVFKGEKCISGKATGSFFRNEVEIALAKTLSSLILKESRLLPNHFLMNSWGLFFLMKDRMF